METKFIDLLADILAMDANKIKLHDKFREYTNWDSLTYLSVIAMMDEEFDVQIESREFKLLVYVDDLVNVVTTHAPSLRACEAIQVYRSDSGLLCKLAMT